VTDLFDTAIAYVLKWEGGYSNDPNDEGGETNFGISRRSYPTGVDIKNLTVEQAKAIYRRDFWDRYQLSAITNPPLAIKILDILVNMGGDKPVAGRKSGATVIQEALCNTGHPVAVDGQFGTATLAAINQSNYIDLLMEIRAQESVHYASLVLHNPSEREFLLGWMRRATS
jgi:lysozyme family protein